MGTATLNTSTALKKGDTAIVNDKLYYTTSGARKKMLCGKNTIVNSINDGSLEVLVHPIGNLFSQESIDRWVESRIVNSGKKK